MSDSLGWMDGWLASVLEKFDFNLILSLVCNVNSKWNEMTDEGLVCYEGSHESQISNVLHFGDTGLLFYKNSKNNSKSSFTFFRKKLN